MNLTQDEIRAILTLLDRAPTKGLQEAQVLVHVTNRLKQLHNEVADGEDTPAAD